jgi:hypothetical protein
MIASFSKNFIFLKTHKTASTSSEIILSAWCSGRDICTPFSAMDEITRIAFGGIAMNFADEVDYVTKFQEAARAGDVAAMKSLRSPVQKRFTNHMRGTKVRELIPELWNTGHKFTVERHPYDRVISRVYWTRVYWNRKGAEPDDLCSEIDKAIEHPFFPNFPIYSENGNLLVDEIIRYDRLWPRINEMAAQYGEKPVTDPPKAKGSFRTNRRLPEELLSAKQKARVYERTAVEFEIMGFVRALPFSMTSLLDFMTSLLDALL